jgi:hypothetical protein
MPGPTGGKTPPARPRRRADESAPVAWQARKTLAQHSHLSPRLAPRRAKVTWVPRRRALVWLAVVAAAVVAGVWLWRHAWVLVGVGRGFRGYLDGWAIDVEHGFGLVERAKIALAFGLPILAVGVVLSVLWTVAAGVVAVLGRLWRVWRVHWRRPF